jgi:hypothetical protein
MNSRVSMKTNRVFIIACALAMLAAPADAQQAAQLPRIGILMQTASPPPPTPQVEWLLQGLREHGYEDGRNVAFEIRYGANDVRRPAIFYARSFAEEGGLMAYGPVLPDVFRAAAGLIDKILKGAKPAELPWQQPTKFDLVINLKTAKALGLRIPQSVLIRADEVIQ